MCKARKAIAIISATAMILSLTACSTQSRQNTVASTQMTQSEEST